MEGLFSEFYGMCLLLFFYIYIGLLWDLKLL